MGRDYHTPAFDKVCFMNGVAGGSGAGRGGLGF